MFIKGDGLRWSSSKIGNIYSQAIERNLITTLRTDDVWWPADMLSQPFGQGTKVYDEFEVVKMMYDLEEHSNYQ